MINREAINNRFKLACHRLAARRMRARPQLLAMAREIVEHWASYADTPDFVAEWRNLLSLPESDLRRAMVARNEYADRLRLSSPFLQLGRQYMTDQERLRLWRIVRRGHPTVH